MTDKAKKGEEFVRKFPAHEAEKPNNSLSDELKAHEASQLEWRNKLKAEIKAEILAELAEGAEEESPKKKR